MILCSVRQRRPQPSDPSLSSSPYEKDDKSEMLSGGEEADKGLGSLSSFLALGMLRWVSTVSSIWIQCTSGPLYTSSIYFETPKSSQHYVQSTLDTVAIFKDFGANVGILSGLVYISLPIDPSEKNWALVSSLFRCCPMFSRLFSRVGWCR